jgi:hypothetical protein
MASDGLGRVPGHGLGFRGLRTRTVWLPRVLHMTQGSMMKVEAVSVESADAPALA